MLLTNSMKPSFKVFLEGGGGEVDLNIKLRKTTQNRVTEIEH